MDNRLRVTEHWGKIGRGAERQRDREAEGHRNREAEGHRG